MLGGRWASSVNTAARRHVVAGVSSSASRRPAVPARSSPGPAAAVSTPSPCVGRQDGACESALRRKPEHSGSVHPVGEYPGQLRSRCTKGARPLSLERGAWTTVSAR